MGEWFGLVGFWCLGYTAAAGALGVDGQAPGWRVLWGVAIGVVAVFLSGVGFCTQRNTTSPCGGRRSLFFASAKKTNEKKADPAGGRAIRLSNVDDFVVRPGVPAGFCRYRLD